MSKATHVHLSRRERQIMDILYKNGQATAADVQASLPDGPGYSAVRALLRVLEEKGHVRHDEKDLRYVYLPTVPRDKVRNSALSHMMETFFDGSAEEVVAALLDSRSRQLSRAELDRIARMIAIARKKEASDDPV
jgi:BlaI family transcriptional regulator, penicillinase repressor